MTRPIESLSPREVLALAVAVERANFRRFRTFADMFRGYDAAVAERFEQLAREEEDHEASLVQSFHGRFGTDPTEMDEADVEGVIESPDLDDAEHLLFDSLEPARVYALALKAEEEARSFYRRAAASAREAELAVLFTSLGEMEDEHMRWFQDRIEGKERES